MKKYLIAVISVLIAGASRAQLMTVKEVTARPAITLNLSKQPIVDINSKLTVELNRSQLVASLASSTKANPELTGRLNDLISLLTSERQILSLLKPAIAGAAANPDSLRAYSKLMDIFYMKLVKEPDLRKMVDGLFADAKRKIADKTYDKEMYPTLQSYVIKNLNSLMEQITAGISNSKDLSSYKIQLAAFVSTKTVNDQKVHIENFDNYTAGEYYDVPRWVTSFSQDDVASFRKITQLSNTLNKEVSGNFSNLLKLIPDTLNCYSCFSKLVAELQTMESSLSAQGSGQVNAFLTAVAAKIIPVYDAMQVFQRQKSGTSLNPLEQFNQVSSTLITLVQNLQPTIDTISSQLPKEALAVNQNLKPLIADLQSCIAILQTDIKTISGVYNTIANLLQPIQGSASAAQKVTGNVFDFNINQLPPIGYIDLKTTGKRENGDKLVIKIMTRTQDDINKNSPGITIDSETIEMQQVSFYSESNIAVILASPLGANSEVTLKSKFQFAPSGSLIVKFGSRNHPFWNTVNPGLGVNISTPDFNLDGSPDISYGGVFTLFHNIISMGLAYNTKTSSGFWFFGLSLPFSTFGLPVGSVQTQKQ